jgi:cysteine dioxygenase
MTGLDSIQRAFKTLISLPQIETEDLVQALQGIEIGDEELASLLKVSIEHPYGRHVLFENDRLEIMIAVWQRGFPCAPHDHGEANSAISVLRGRSCHKGYQLNDNKLEIVFSEKKSVGEIITCKPFQVHAMGDDNGSAPLVTLHFYSGAIETMLVYTDTETHMVSGDAGAWFPVNEEEQLLNSLEGHVSRSRFSEK